MNGLPSKVFVVNVSFDVKEEEMEEPVRAVVIWIFVDEDIKTMAVSLRRVYDTPRKVKAFSQRFCLYYLRRDV